MYAIALTNITHHLHLTQACFFRSRQQTLKVSFKKNHKTPKHLGLLNGVDQHICSFQLRLEAIRSVNIKLIFKVNNITLEAFGKPYQTESSEWQL